jgi:hypothetical protein
MRIYLLLNVTAAGIFPRVAYPSLCRETFNKPKPACNLGGARYARCSPDLPEAQTSGFF